MTQQSVLIVDDVPQIRKVLSDCLSEKGMMVCGTARNGQEAIDLAGQHKPDFILLDIVMPILQGYEALPILRKQHPQALIVMLTSTSEQNLVLECRKHGANGFIIKSDDLTESLYDRLQMLWKKRQEKINQS